MKRLFNALEGAGRGAKHQFEFDIATAGGSISMPVIWVRGAKPGPTLVCTAGVHGDEYEGVQTLLEVCSSLDAESMSGDLLAVPVVNPPAFWAGTRTSPLDGENLARVFPGSPQGAPSETLAWNLDQFFLSRASFYLDLHSGGMRYEMPSLVGYDASDERSRAAAEAFGSAVLWAHPNTPPGRTVSAAKARGIPYLYTEARGAGRVHPSDLRLFRRGITNLLRHLSILPGEPEKTACQWHLFGDGDIDGGVHAYERGFLIPKVEILQQVREGDPLGVLTDLLGRNIETYRSPIDGVVALIHSCPLVAPREPVFLVTGLLPQASAA